MKKVARLRVSPAETTVSVMVAEQGSVRTTGRIKKPKAVFDPSDNYLPKAQRVSNAIANVSVTSPERKKEAFPSNALTSPQNAKKGVQSTTPGLAAGPAQVTSPYSDINCFICNRPEAKRGVSARNKLVTCVDCSKRVHKFCLDVEFDDFELLQKIYKCENCRSCDVCSALGDDVSNSGLVTCAKCVKSFHFNCHIPNVLQFQQTQRNWKCNKCSVPSINSSNFLPVQAIREIIGDEPNALALQTLNQVESKKSSVKRQMQEPIQNANSDSTESDEDILDIAKSKIRAIEGSNNDNANPSNMQLVHYNSSELLDIPNDVKHWDVDKVAEFFAKYFPNEAQVFRDQEIDGTSLLLMKRSDVLKKLPIKLGPSLRIYNFILKIQTQSNDPTLGWNCGM